MSGQKIIDGLKDAIAGNFARVTLEGQVWVRQEYVTRRALAKADVQEDASVGKHTPGPWYAMTRESGGLLDQATVCSEHETDGEPTFIADTMGLDGEVPLEQRKANARLMAAAPDMLKALTDAIPALVRMHGMTAAGKNRSLRLAQLNAARAAISKAEGRS